MASFCPYPPGSRVATYLRHSPGEEQTIESQEGAIRDWCQKHQLDLANLFEDEARTGSTTAGRDAFLRMVDWLRQAGGRRALPAAATTSIGPAWYAAAFANGQVHKAVIFP